MKVLVFTNLYPNIQNPNFGIFIRNRTRAIRKISDVEIKVIAPVPWFPPLNISERWYRFSQIPEYERVDGIDVYHPRYLVTPKVGMAFYGYSMYLGTRKLLERLHDKYPFDLIDAHFLYPDGFAAFLLGRYVSCPVVLNARGSDVTLYTQLALIKSLISRTLQNVDQLVAVSKSLGDIMVNNGADQNKIAVIPNGIDPCVFGLQDREIAREKLGLEANSKIILTVCSLVELKGVHLLIEAIGHVKDSFSRQVQLVVVGAGPERVRLEELTVRLGLCDHVFFAGSIPNAELPDWYNAADLFFLGSSREGWPNVVCEAQACGVPVVATPVNGIPEILDSPDLGIMVERTPEAFAQGIKEALSRSWDRQLIAEKGRQRTWEKVAEEVYDLFAKVLKDAKN